MVKCYCDENVLGSGWLQTVVASVIGRIYVLHSLFLGHSHDMNHKKKKGREQQFSGSDLL